MRELERAQIRVLSWPVPSVVSLLFEAVGARAHGAPNSLLDDVRRVLPSNADEVLRPLTDPGADIPDCLVPLPTGMGEGWQDALDQLCDVSGDDLLRAVTDGAGDVPPRWRPAARRPSVWLAVYQRALALAWERLRPVWRSAADRVALDVERAAVAAQRGVAAHFLASAPESVMRGDRLCFPSCASTDWRISKRGLLILPLVALRSGTVLGHDDAGELTHVAYALGGGAATIERPAPDALAALLGHRRADILLRLARPFTPGELARALEVVPSAVTAHLDALSRAELVARERQGRRVLVHRTPRGEALVTLYEDG